MLLLLLLLYVREILSEVAVLLEGLVYEGVVEKTLLSLMLIILGPFFSIPAPSIALLHDWVLHGGVIPARGLEVGVVLSSTSQSVAIKLLTLLHVISL